MKIDGKTPQNTLKTVLSLTKNEPAIRDAGAERLSPSTKSGAKF
jgi:hypothetical protein